MKPARPHDAVILPAFGRSGRLLAGVVCSVLVHVALILGWQATRTMPSAPAQAPSRMLWVRVAPPPAALAPRAPAARALPVPASASRARQGAAPTSTASTASAPRAAKAPEPVAESSGADAVATPLPDAGPAPLPDAATILDQARRSAGGIERALRKERQPTIVAPPDSPEIRMRDGMAQARSLAPTRLWEAPKTEELVNNTGDGARRTRVITGNGTYCITERSPVTSIDMIEKHGRQRFTNCPQHEEPAKRQAWRTARD